jgi:hypothetical protein
MTSKKNLLHEVMIKELHKLYNNINKYGFSI